MARTSFLDEKSIIVDVNGIRRSDANYSLNDNFLNDMKTTTLNTNYLQLNNRFK